MPRDEARVRRCSKKASPKPSTIKCVRHPGRKRRATNQSMAKSYSKLKLPQLRRVRLRRFSLYAANPDADFPVEEGVLCIIGANGLGKSTLLSAINFGFTGIVPDPGRRFESMEEY